MFNIFNIFKKRKIDDKLTEKSQLMMFGVWQSPTGPRLILEKQETGGLACTKCKGYGTHGNPLCGALYVCSQCNGSGKK